MLSVNNNSQSNENLKPFIINDMSEEALINNNLTKVRDYLEEISSKAMLIPQATYKDPLSLDSTLIPIAGRPYIRKTDKVKGWIFKTSDKDALFGRVDEKSLCQRVTRAEEIRKMDYPCIIVPKKYIWKFPSSCVVVAEELDLTDQSRPLKKEEAEVLIRIIHQVKLWDMNSGNVRFHKNGQIALIDTEANEIELSRPLKYMPGLSSLMNHVHNTGGVALLNNWCTDSGIKKMYVQTQKTQLAGFTRENAIKIMISVLFFLKFSKNAQSRFNSFLKSTAKISTIWHLCLGALGLITRPVLSTAIYFLDDKK